MVRTYLTPVLHAQPVQFVQPIWDGLAIPAKGQLEGIVYPLFLFLFFRALLRCRCWWRLWLALFEKLLLTLARRQREAPLDVRFCVIEHRCERCKQLGAQMCEQCRGAVFRFRIGMFMVVRVSVAVLSMGRAVGVHGWLAGLCLLSCCFDVLLGREMCIIYGLF